MMFFLFFIAVVSAEKALVLGGEENGVIELGVLKINMSSAMFLKKDVNKCLYLGTNSTEKYVVEGEKITHYQYKNENCNGNVTGKDVTTTMKNFYKEPPKHAAFKSYIKDTNCAHESMTPRLYYKDGCNGITLTPLLGQAQTIYIEYEEVNKVMWGLLYADAKCDVKYVDDKKAHLGIELQKCDSCINGYKFQCGAVSSMILAVLLLLAFLL